MQAYVSRVFVSIALFAIVTLASAHDDLRFHWDIVNDVNARAADRVASEHALLRMTDPAMLRIMFRDMFRRPIGPYDGESGFVALGHSPYLGGPEAAEEAGWSQYPFIYRARLNLWNHFAQNSQPDEERRRIIQEFFDEWETEHELYLLFGSSMWNHTEGLEEKLWSLFADREQPAAMRIASASTLSQTTHRHSYTSYAHYGHRMIEYVWEERGSEVAMSFGEHVSRHPLQNVLMLDWYERERDPETRKSRMSMKDVVDKIDQSFKNISGLYEQRRGTTSDKAVAIARQRMALQQEARETGDDTKLREFDAEVTEKQQAELELRIERIDAWIAENRDRLEQEAEEYHRERMREQREED